MTGPARVRDACRILYADTDPELVRRFRAALEPLGRSVALSVAGSSTEALEALSGTTPFQLLVLDLALPPEGGLHVVRRVRASRSLPPLPVLVLAAASGSEAAGAAYEAGANAFVPRPRDPDACRLSLDALVRFWLGSVTLP
jgi:CheY-like chemotaxis protein